MCVCVFVCVRVCMCVCVCVSTIETMWYIPINLNVLKQLYVDL